MRPAQVLSMFDVERSAFLSGLQYEDHLWVDHVQLRIN